MLLVFYKTLNLELSRNRPQGEITRNTAFLIYPTCNTSNFATKTRTPAIAWVLHQALIGKACDSTHTCPHTLY